MNHHNQFIFITGSSSGMGKAAARLLSTEHNLILQGRDMERLSDVGEVCREFGNKVLLFPYDFSEVTTLGVDVAAFLKTQNAAVKSFVHFAGMTDLLPMSHNKYSIGLRVMNVNYFAATEILGALLKKRVNADNLTNVVLVSSISVIQGAKCQPHYCASKGAIESLTTTLACELAPRVRVNCISPGSFNTRIMQTIFADRSEETWNPNTLLPWRDVSEIANAARFLLSKESSYITGQIMYVDGGQRFLR